MLVLIFGVEVALLTLMKNLFEPGSKRAFISLWVTGMVTISTV